MWSNLKSLQTWLQEWTMILSGDVQKKGTLCCTMVMILRSLLGTARSVCQFVHLTSFSTSKLNLFSHSHVGQRMLSTLGFSAGYDVDTWGISAGQGEKHSWWVCAIHVLSSSSRLPLKDEAQEAHGMDMYLDLSQIHTMSLVMSSILIHDESASLTRTGKTSLAHLELLAHLFSMAGERLPWTWVRSWLLLFRRYAQKQVDYCNMISFHVFSDRMNVTCQFVSRIGSKRPRPFGCGRVLAMGVSSRFPSVPWSCRLLHWKVFLYVMDPC